MLKIASLPPVSAISASPLLGTIPLERVSDMRGSTKNMRLNA